MLYFFSSSRGLFCRLFGDFEFLGYREGPSFPPFFHHALLVCSIHLSLSYIWLQENNENKKNENIAQHTQKMGIRRPMSQSSLTSPSITFILVFCSGLYLGALLPNENWRPKPFISKDSPRYGGQMLRASFMTSSSESQAIIPGAATDWVESRSGNSDKRNRNGNRNSNGGGGGGGGEEDNESDSCDCSKKKSAS